MHDGNNGGNSCDFFLKKTLNGDVSSTAE